ncbi:MAG TPA: glycine betaine ABC transporter substrate-binding protein [Acidothermaceae bacterium]|nr:glycine betaine ABC transporter substrate-binding protein [Acidothermaceae bacterium]
MNRKVLLIGATGITLALGLVGCSSSKKAASTPSSAAPPTTTAAASSAAPAPSSAAASVPAAASSAAPAPSSAASGPTIASQLILGAPPEFQTRVDGIAGLAKNYGVTFKSFKPLDEAGPVTIAALKNGQVDAADIFSTDPSIAANNFVVLADPKSNFAAQNILPLVNKAKATDGVKSTLNAISAKLTTPGVTALLVQVITNKQDPDAVAKSWLTSQGLDTKGTAASGSKLVVGSANFPENVLLADIYAEALKDQGASVSTKLNIGSREKYLPGLEDGSIDVLPEYNGALLQFVDKTATAVSPTDVYAALQTALPSSLIVLPQSAAQDSDAIVVTKATAAKYNLTSIADLAKPAS